VVPGGARVEREVDFDFAGLTVMRLALRTPDFTTAAQIETAINGTLGRGVAVMTDSGTVSLDLAAAGLRSPAHVIARIENLPLQPQMRARVVVDQRSGTIVMGEGVRIGRVAVAQGGLTLRVEETPVASQPNPFAQGETLMLPRTSASVDADPGTGLAELQAGTDLSTVVAGLNALGVAPQDMIDILKSINAAGALHAELVVQ
jgi:flagellar P-ring protein precursor FlgI